MKAAEWTTFSGLSFIDPLAYSFGRPLIATDVGDFEQVVEDGRSGCLLNENSADCLANTVSEAFSKNTSLENMGTCPRVK
jgi:glycosyltransferase involved in cell wall biosynthesis